MDVAVQQPKQHQQPTTPALSSSSAASGHSQPIRYRHSCENCRRRKIKCSGTRPTCDHCKRRSIQCIYKPLARSSRRAATGVTSPALSHPIASPYDFAASQLRAAHTPSVNASGHVQPIAISMATSSHYSHKSSLQVFKDQQEQLGEHCASAPASNMVSPFTPSIYIQPPQKTQQQKQATAIPPHLCNGDTNGSMASPLQSPQLSYMYGPLGSADMMTGSSPASYNSVQSDLSDLASQHNFMAISNGGTPIGNITDNPLNTFAALSNSIYDLQIPGHLSNHHQQQGAGDMFPSDMATVEPSSLVAAANAAASAFSLPQQVSIPSSSHKLGGIGDNKPDGWHPASTNDPLLSGVNTRLTTSPPDFVSKRTDSVFNSGNTPGHRRTSTLDVAILGRSAMEDINNSHQAQQLPPPVSSDLDALLPIVESNNLLHACSSQSYIDIMSSCTPCHEPGTAEDRSLMLDALHLPQAIALPSQQQQQQQQQHAAGIASNLATYKGNRVDK